ncbi:MAG TPA: enoyl-CoA hydratase-related protein [Blastocatellia bacterium]|nr:enoyl-CoA hydratase-related protein [Blastocatellia bacterium]
MPAQFTSPSSSVSRAVASAASSIIKWDTLDTARGADPSLNIEGVETIMAENVLLERRGRIALITINRPDKLNALNIATRKELADTLDELRNDEEVRVAVITGAGEKAFVAGADISEFAGRTAVQQRAVMKERSVFVSAEDFPKPLVAMINGFCLGGGCELALSCDIRIASDRAKFGQPEINLGIIPGGGGTQRLTRLIGEGKAMQLILTGEMINAQEAYRLGLVNEVHPAAELEAKTMEMANKIAEKSPIALAMAKTSVKNAARTTLREGLDREIDLFALCFSSEDKEEGVRAFLEKRKPEFKGK